MHYVLDESDVQKSIQTCIQEVHITALINIDSSPTTLNAERIIPPDANLPSTRLIVYSTGKRHIDISDRFYYRQIPY